MVLKYDNFPIFHSGFILSLAGHGLHNALYIAIYLWVALNRRLIFSFHEKLGNPFGSFRHPIP